jgi:purine-nucleoside phosphorylase
MLQRIIETSEFLKQKIGATPRIAIILGTGLGNLIDQIEIKKEVSYSGIPNFPISTVKDMLENSFMAF